MFPLCFDCISCGPFSLWVSCFRFSSFASTVTFAFVTEKLDCRKSNFVRLMGRQIESTLRVLFIHSFLHLLTLILRTGNRFRASRTYRSCTTRVISRDRPMRPCGPKRSLGVFQHLVVKAHPAYLRTFNAD